MSIISTSQFTIRDYECDAYGHLNHANYIRLMQEAAFDASIMVGYPKTRYEAMNRLWLARETTIEYQAPLFYGDVVTIKTWVADFRGVRSLRQYEFYRGDERVAKAQTDWVFLDSEISKVVAVPLEIVAAYAGDEPVQRLPRTGFPQPPPPPDGAYTLRKRVEWRDIDGAKHLNNAAYFNYIEDCAIQVATHFGWPSSRTMRVGMALVAHLHHIEYREPALMDDEIDIKTWLFNVRRSSAIRHYDLIRVRDGVLLARAQTQWAAVNLETGKPMRVPDSFVTDFEPNIAS